MHVKENASDPRRHEVQSQPENIDGICAVSAQRRQHHRRSPPNISHHRPNDPAATIASPRTLGTGIHDARLLAAHIEQPNEVTPTKWIGGLATSTPGPLATPAATTSSPNPLRMGQSLEWSVAILNSSTRAGFAAMASLAVHDKKADDSRFIDFLERIEGEAADEAPLRQKSRQLGSAPDRQA